MMTMLHTITDQRDSLRTADAVLMERRGNAMIITNNRPEARNAVTSAVSTA